MNNKNILNIKNTNNIINQKIDHIIYKIFKNVKKQQLHRMIEMGLIKINNQIVHPNYIIKKGDILSYVQHFELKKKKNIFLSKKIKKKFNSYILFEDEDLLIINKPPGIAVHGGSGLKFGIIEIFRLIKKENHFLELVHRIDRNTSGILMLAKKKTVLKNMHQQFRENKIFKSYTAIVHGIIESQQQSVSIPLLKTKLKNGKKIITTNILGKKSISIFKVKKILNQNTLVEIIPMTGRTHQIRVHAAYIGFPIIFDDIYGNKLLDSNFFLNKKYKKVLLHASKITFYHPKYYKKYYIYAPLEKRFIKFLKHI